MAIESDADRRLFVQPDDFAVPVTWVHSGGTATFPALFDTDYQLLASPFVEGGAEGRNPHIQACRADIPATGRQGDTVTIGGTLYRVGEIKPDGTGMTIVRLREI